MDQCMDQCMDQRMDQLNDQLNGPMDQMHGPTNGPMDQMDGPLTGGSSRALRRASAARVQARDFSSWRFWQSRRLFTRPTPITRPQNCLFYRSSTDEQHVFFPHLSLQLRAKTRCCVNGRPLISAARDIESSDYGGTSDPYCLLELSGVRRRTATIFRTLKPVWGERFVFVGSKELETDEVECNLFDEDRFGAHDFLGGITIPIPLVEEGTKAPAHWVCLQPKKPAKEPFRGTLKACSILSTRTSPKFHFNFAARL